MGYISTVDQLTVRRVAEVKAVGVEESRRRVGACCLLLVRRYTFLYL